MNPNGYKQQGWTVVVLLVNYNLLKAKINQDILLS